MSKIFSNVVAVNVATGPVITLASGRQFDLLDPYGSEFEIEDIAHGLANICRYAGQCTDFYSVAEHSILVSEVVTEYKFEALLHDASEAFVGDVTRPLKQLLPDYKRIEATIQGAISARFNLQRSSRAIVKKADLQVLAAEQLQVMPEGTAAWAAEARVAPAPVVVKFKSPKAAKREFLEVFEELQRYRCAV